MSTNNESQKAKKSAGLTIEQLMDQEKWADVRKRLARISSPKRVGELLFHSADNPSVPEDIFHVLFDKLDDGERDYETSLNSNYSSVTGTFWCYVCNYNRERGYGKSFSDVCSRQSLSSLTILFDEFADTVGNLTIKSARGTICSLWNDQLASPGYSRYSSSHPCDEAKDTFLCSVSSMKDLQTNSELCILWRKTELIMESTNQNVPLVHAMIRARLPLFLVWLAVKLYPNQIKERDSKGRIPLHWACLLNNRNSHEDFKIKFKEGGALSRVSKNRVVDLTLNAFPEGATYADVEGVVPLVSLLDLEYTSWTLNSWTQRCVLAVMKQAPEALTSRNIKNFMLPFMTAACIHDQNTTMANTKGEEKQMLQRKLDMTYALLRQDPSVVSLGVNETLHEKYLQKKLAEEKDKSKRLEMELEKLKVEMIRGQDEGVHESTEDRKKPAKRRRV